MFELPINTATTYVNRYRMRERQLRYRYINESSKQYSQYEQRNRTSKRKSPRHGYVTPPETSHGEDESDSDSDSSNEHAMPDNRRVTKRRKKKVKWTALYRQDTQQLAEDGNHFGSVIPKEVDTNLDGDETVDVNNEELEQHEDEEGNIISSVDERIYFNSRHKPQQTYEVWQDPEAIPHTPLNTKLLRYPDYIHVFTITKSKMKEHLAQASVPLRARHMLIPEGLYLYDENNASTYYRNPAIQDKHTEILITLLHHHISRFNWSLAYRIFALLVRLPRVDIRSIWQYGVTILNHNKQSTQCLKFLEWMHSVFASRKTFRLASVLQVDPVFRGSSRNHTAQFTLTWLWNSLIYYSTNGGRHKRHGYGEDNGNDNGMHDFSEEKIEQLIEKLNELILTPPYMEDGEVWFILAMCHMVKADHTSLIYLKDRENQSYHRKQFIYKRVTHDISEVIKYLKECKARQKGDFMYPEDYIMRSLTQIEMRVSEEDEDEGESDTDESEDSGEDKSRSLPLPTATVEEQYDRLLPQEQPQQQRQQQQPEGNPPELQFDSGSFQVDDENSFLQALDMPDYLDDAADANYNDNDNNYYTNRDSDEGDYSSE